MKQKNIVLNRIVNWKLGALAALAFAALGSSPALAGDEDEVRFNMVRSGAVVTAGANVLPNARGRVTIESVGPVEIMNVNVSGLPPNTDFDFFVIQVPNGPFGLTWYQGDIETNRYGVGYGRFIGRFSIETFIVATGSAPAPLVFNDPPFQDASTNPPTNPVQLYHLGLWFNNPNDAAKAGLPATVTPFNGEHHAGLQVLSTRNFPADHGPLRDVKP